MNDLALDNLENDLYFNGGRYTGGRVVFIPKGWCSHFGEGDSDDDGPSAYGWMGGADVLAYQSRKDREFMTYDAGWTSYAELQKMSRLTEEDARRLDPELFELLDAVNRGSAK